MIVGREQQLTALLHHIDRTIARIEGPNVLFITGDAGIGKTTLIEAMLNERASVGNCVFSRVTCSTPLAGQDIGEVEALLPWAELMTKLAVGENEKKLETRKLVGELALAWVRCLPVVGDVLESVIDTARIVKGARDKHEEHEHPVGAANQQQMFQQYINVLATLSESVPIALIIDDFHWADTSSTNLLFAASRQLQDRPVLFIIAYRPDDASSSRAGEGHPILHVRNELERYSLAEDVSVTRITAENIDTLLRLRYPGYQNNDAFEEWMARISSGNPLFITQFLQTLEEDGYIDPNKGVIKPGFENETAPSSAYAVVQERIRRLNIETQELLRYASVEGETFTAAVLAAITETPQLKLLQKLRLVEQTHHVVRSLGKLLVYAHETTSYQFAHALLHKAMYDSLEQEERELLHEAVFDVIKQEWGTAIEAHMKNLSSIAARLAVHAEVLGEHLFAAEVLLEGARSSWREYAEQETLRQIEGALRQIELFNDDTNQRARTIRAEILLSRGEVQALRGERVGALEDFRGARRTFEQLSIRDRAIEAMNFEASILYRQGLHDECETLALATLDAARTLNDQRGQALALRTVGVLRYQTRRYDEALDFYQQSLDIEQQRGSRKGEADMLGNIGNIHFQSGRIDEALDCYQRSLTTYNAISDSLGRARMMTNIGLILQKRGETTAAMENFDQALGLCRSTGARAIEASVLDIIGGALDEAHRHNEALDMLARSLALRQALGDSVGEATSLSNIGRILLDMGRIDDATERLERAAAIADEHGFVVQQTTAHIHLARALKERGQTQRAVEHLETAREVARTNGLREQESQCTQMIEEFTQEQPSR